VSASAALDWTATRRQLSELGVVRFQVEQLPAGAARFSCWLAGANAAGPIQADGSSEAEAVRLCLERAREQQMRKR
jgi:hypothetical protein